MQLLHTRLAGPPERFNLFEMFHDSFKDDDTLLVLQVSPGQVAYQNRSEESFQIRTNDVLKWLHGVKITNVGSAVLKRHAAHNLIVQPDLVMLLGGLEQIDHRHAQDDPGLVTSDIG